MSAESLSRLAAGFWTLVETGNAQVPMRVEPNITRMISVAGIPLVVLWGLYGSYAWIRKGS